MRVYEQCMLHALLRNGSHLPLLRSRAMERLKRSVAAHLLRFNLLRSMVAEEVRGGRLLVKNQAANKMVSKLSGGMRKRAHIAFDIVSGSRVLLLDEPTSGLDSETTLEALRSVRQHVQAGAAHAGQVGMSNPSAVVVIHQPSVEAMQQGFDYLLLLRPVRSSSGASFGTPAIRARVGGIESPCLIAVEPNFDAAVPTVGLLHGQPMHLLCARRQSQQDGASSDRRSWHSFGARAWHQRRSALLHAQQPDSHEGRCFANRRTAPYSRPGARYAVVSGGH